MQNREQEVRCIAYRLWQSDGEPAGLETEHWRRAEEIWSDANSPTSRVSDEPFGEPAESILAVANQAPSSALDDQSERAPAPRRQRRK